MATPRVQPEAPAGETCPGLAPTAGSGRVSKPHGAVPFMSPPRAGDARGERPDLVGLEAQALKGPVLQPHRHLQPTHLFPFGSRVSFEAGESWGALWGRRGAQISCPQPRPPPPPLEAPGECPDSPWVPGGHRVLGLREDLVHPETQSTLHVSPVLAVPTPLPQQTPPQAQPPPRGHSPLGRGSLEGHQAQASRGPPGGRWGQSSQEGLPSQLLPAERAEWGPDA